MREDVRIARRDARGLIAIAVTVLPLMAFIWVATLFDLAPRGNPSPAPSLLSEPLVLPVLAMLVYFVGLAWMIRIYRTSHLEPETSNWRYRELDP
jgi:hypothetical protein